MVDAVPTRARAQTHARSTSFLSFSFRSRSSSNSQRQTLPPVREVSGIDEFGAGPPHPSAAAATTVSIAPSAATANNTMAATLSPPRPDEPPGSPRVLPAPARQLHPEIRSLVQLATSHAHKVYFSGPLVKHVERHTDGKLVGKGEPWRDVWAQLGGTTLSVWDMKEIEEASKRGAEVPPTYINITDASIHVLGAVTMPGLDGTHVKYSNVVTLTTAGLNLLLFSCPSPQALMSWTAALRLSAYEKSRLEELYTAHLLRMSLSEQGAWKDPRSPLANGCLEGWVKIRINGQTDWKRLWMCVQAGREPDVPGGRDMMPRKNRMSSLFGRASHEHSNSVTSFSTGAELVRPPYIGLYVSPKARDRKKAVLTLGSISQVFAVYPERPELISRSTLIKIEGFIGDEELAGEWRSREGWLLMMPEADSGKPGSLEMLRWLIGLHDAFRLYGRPAGYTWNPRDPASLMFAYPVGPRKDNLFLDRELAEKVDPREDRGSVVRQRFKDILVERMYGQDGTSRIYLSPPITPSVNGSSAIATSSALSLPPIHSVSEQQSQEPQRPHSPQRNGSSSGTFQLPPLSFDSAPQTQQNPHDGTSLSPITERSYDYSRGSTQEHLRSAPSTTSASESVTLSARGGPVQSTIEEEGVIGGRRVGSPEGSAISHVSQQRQRAAGPSSPRQASQIKPCFSQDSMSGSGSGSVSGLEPARVTSPARGIRSPPLSSQSESSRYSSPRLGNEPASLQPVASIVQTSFSERDTSLPLNVQTPASPASPLSVRMTPQHDQVLLSPASHVSHSAIPTSPFSIIDGAGSGSASVRASLVKEKEQPPLPPSKSPKQGATSSAWQPQYKPKTRAAEYIFDEPGALYYVQQQRQEAKMPTRATTDSDEEETDDKSEPESKHSVLSISRSQQQASSSGTVQQLQPPRMPNVSTSPATRRLTATGFEYVSGRVGVEGSSVRSEGVGGETQIQTQNGGPRALLARRPSGARDPPRVVDKRFLAGESPSSVPLEGDEQPLQQYAIQMSAHSTADEDESVDALAALSFLEQQDDTSFSQQLKSPLPTPQILEPKDRAPSPPSPRTTKKQFRSSFAPSKQAAERKARSEAQQAVHDAAVHKPGRPIGRHRTKPREGGWESSEEEEEEEEEDDDDDDVNSDDEPRATSRPGSGAPSIAAPVGRNPVHQQQLRGLSPSGSTVDVREQQKQMRTLPQIPRGRSPAGSERPFVSDQYDGLRDASVGRPQSQHPQQQYLQQPQLGAARQNMWSSVLDAGRDTGLPVPQNNNNRNTFVQIESHSETMTKAFTPQGLLSAGMADKQDRSAKRQEEVARETGGSLINVPHKPPPPQVGLLGAITAHERDRKREGGVGATLTEREREKRFAEERQRRLDELQRQQLEQQQQYMQQFGGMGMYGGGGLAPQMTGMNPMMGGFGYPSMMGGPQSMYFNPMFNPMMANPQHMYAAQQAAQAYQQAMIAMSTAGSQVGGEGGGANEAAGNQNIGPMMGGGMGFDPRMSMMGMGMMGPMGVPGMMGMPEMASPVGMQLTGNSNMSGQGGMEPRFPLMSGAFDGSGSLSVSQGQGSGPQSQRPSPYNGTPAASPAPAASARGDNEPNSRG